MQTQLVRWGKSLALPLAPELAKELKLVDGMKVSINVVDGGLLLLIGPMKYRISLEELVSGITKENTHCEIDWGQAVEREVW